MPTGEDLRRRSRFVVSRVGTCSFCGKRDDEVSAFAGIASRPHRICGGCLALCLDVTCELDKRGEREALRRELASFEPGRELYEQLAPKLRSGDIDGVVEAMRKAGRSDIDPDQLRALLGSLRSNRSCSVGPRQPDPAAEDGCNFCDSAPDDVAKLLHGPGATICDRCIDDSSTEVLATLVAT